MLGDSENLAENYLGRVVTTDTEALLYLRGRFGRVEGFRNVIFDDKETSGTAFVRHSPKVARLLIDLEDRKVRLGRVDLYRQIACLEAQVDLLTELVLAQRGRAPDTAPGSTEAEILRRVLRDSLPDSISADELKALLDYKRTLREIDPKNGTSRNYGKVPTMR